MYIGPERCGKTEMALNLFTATPDGHATFVTTEDEIKKVYLFLDDNGLHDHKRYIMSIDKFLLKGEMEDYLYGVSNPCIIFDNYFSYTLSQRVAAYIKIHSVVVNYDIHVFGTPNKLYDTKLLDKIRETKQKHSLFKTISSSTAKNIKEVFYNFLTDVDANITSLRRPIYEDELLKYMNDNEKLLTRAIGLYERRKI